MTVCRFETIEERLEEGVINIQGRNGESYPLSDKNFQGASIEVSGSPDSQIWQADYRVAHGGFVPSTNYARPVERDDDGKIVLFPNTVYYVEGPFVTTNFDISSQGRSTLGRHFVEGNIVGDRRKYIDGSGKTTKTWIELVSHVHPIRISPEENLAHLIFHRDHAKISEEAMKAVYGDTKRGFGFYNKDETLIPIEDIRNGSSVMMTLADNGALLTKPSPRIVDFKGKPSLKELENELYHHIDFRDGKLMLSPGDRMLAHTNEVTQLSPSFMGMMGDYTPSADLHPHASAGMGDPGFEGQYTLEIMYNGLTRLMLEAGMPIASYQVHALDAPTKKVYGSKESKNGGNQYHGQRGTTLPETQQTLD